MKARMLLIGLVSILNLAMGHEANPAISWYARFRIDQNFYELIIKSDAAKQYLLSYAAGLKPEPTNHQDFYQWFAELRPFSKRQPHLLALVRCEYQRCQKVKGIYGGRTPN